MTTPRSTCWRIAAFVAVAMMTFAWAQTRVNGTVGPCAEVAPADLVAEARAGLAWFPVEVGRGTVGADGSFALTFEEEPYLPIEITVAAGHLFDGLRCEEISISDPEARMVVVRELRIVPRGAACEYCETLGTLYAATKPIGSFATTGDVAVHWIHAAGPVTIEGTCHYGWGDEIYGLDLEAGWNTVVLETVTVYPSEGFCDCHDVLVVVDRFPRASVAWHFVPAR